MTYRQWLERQRNIIDYGFQNLVRRKGKSFFILFIFVLLIAVISSILFLTGSLTREMMATSEQLPEITVQKIQGGRQVNLEETYLGSINRIPGVEAVEPRVWGYVYLAVLDANFTVFGFDLAQLESTDFLSPDVPYAARSQAEPASTDYQMVVGQGVYKLLEQVQMQDRYLFFHPGRNEAIPIDVIGVFRSETELQSVDLMMLQVEGAREVLELAAGEYTDAAVYVTNPEEVDTIALKIRRLFPELRTITKSQIQSTYLSAFGWKSGLVLSGMLVVVLAFLVLIWDRAGGLSHEEKREIGILKAIGWDTEMILAVKFTEGLILSFVGAVSGMAISYVYVYWLRAPVLKEVFIGWSTVYPSFQLVPHLDLKVLLLIITIAVVPYAAMSIVPAWKAAVTDPDEIIRANG